MLSLRHFASIAWAFLGFMVAAALVFNLRYKPVGEDAYLDTWTGQISSTYRAEGAAPGVAALGITRVVRPGIAVPEESVARRLVDADCWDVRFAFPAPEPSLRR